MSLPKYIPSGRASVPGILMTVLIGVLASLILPIVYVILGKMVPNIWFSAIIAGLFGLGLGACIDMGVEIGKIRNPRIALSIAVFCSLLAFYFQWVFFDELMYSRKELTFNLSGQYIKILASNMYDLFMHPTILFKEICNLNLVGTFKIKNWGVVSGVALWVLWFCEFLLIMGGVILVVLFGKSSKPYSEINDEWMTIRKPTYRIKHLNSKDELLNELNKTSHAFLKDESGVLDPHHFYEVEIYESIGDATKYVIVSDVVNTINRRGKMIPKKTQLVEYYPIDDMKF